MSYRPPAPSKQERQMWTGSLIKYVRYLEAIEIRESAPIEAKPLDWKRIGTRLETATALGLIYSVIEDSEPAGGEFITTVAGVILYGGDDESVAKQAAQDDIARRIRDELVQGENSCV